MSVSVPTLTVAQAIYAQLSTDAGVLAVVGRWLDGLGQRQPAIFMSSEPPVGLSGTPGDTLWPVIVYFPVRQGFSTVRGPERCTYASEWEVQARVPGFDYGACGPTVAAFDTVFRQAWIGPEIWTQVSEPITYQAPDAGGQMWCYLGYRYNVWAQAS